MARENPLDPSLRHVFSTKSGEFLPYERDGKSIPTMSWLPLSADAELGHGGRYLLRLDPGCEGPVHTHHGYDELLVLEGSIIDSDGTVLSPGDYVMYEPGSTHFTDTPEGCVVLVTNVDNPELLDM